jgi:hypothetical protein
VTTCLEAHAMGLGLNELQLQLILLEGSLTGAFAIRNQRYSDVPIMSEVRHCCCCRRRVFFFEALFFFFFFFFFCLHDVVNVNLGFGAYASFGMCRRVGYDRHGFVLFTRRWLRYLCCAMMLKINYTCPCFHFIISLPCSMLHEVPS